MATDNVIYIDNSNILELAGLRNVEIGNFVNDATVLATIKDAKGVDVVGMAWPVTLDYVTGSDGIYTQTLASDLVLIKRRRYHLNLTAVGDGLNAEWDLYVEAKIR